METRSNCGSRRARAVRPMSRMPRNRAGRAGGLPLGVLALLALGACTAPPAPAGRAGLARIDNIVVIYAENRSFDHLYGLFPGAEGIASATAEQKMQLDHDGKPLPHLPPTWDHHGKPMARFPTEELPNAPFRIAAAPIDGRFDAL